MPLLAHKMALVGGQVGGGQAVAPVISTVTVTGTPTEGNTLTATPTYSTPGSPSPTETYVWQYSTDGSTGWTPIGGATSSTYTLDATYAGYFLQAKVSASNSAGSSGAVVSAATARVGTLYFGDGSDGDVTISSSQTLSGAKKYRNLTINSGAVVEVAGLVQVCRTLDAGGGSVIHADGKVGVAGPSDTADVVNMNGGAGGAAGSGGTGTGGVGGNRGGGTPGTYGNGTGGSTSTGPSDGDGGAGANSVDASGGGGTTQTASGTPTSKSTILAYTAGGGGGGGGGAAGHIAGKGSNTYFAGDGGCGGGGLLRVMAQTIANTGGGTFVLRADGGGVTRTNGNGGGGWVMLASYSSGLPSGWSTRARHGSYDAATDQGGSTDGTIVTDFGAGN